MEASPNENENPNEEGPSFMEKFWYKFDVWYASDPSSEVYLLAGVNAFFVFLLFFSFSVTGSLADLSGFEWFSEMLWMSWGQLSGKAPKARDPDGWLWPTRLVRTFAAFAGMFAFSLIVGFIKSALKAQLKALKLGKGKVLEEGFSMIIGWNDRMLPLVEQLTLANESSGGDVIVVLAPRSKPDMDAELLDNIEDWRGSKIVCRKGDPINPNDLLKAAAPYARSIVILSQGDDADEADAQACRCTLALTGGMPPGQDILGHVVVELRDIDNEPVVLMGVPDHWDGLRKKRQVIPLIGNDLTGRLMVQCSQEAGLAHIFSHILAFEKNEFYFSDDQEWMPRLVGTMFCNICFMFHDAICIGIKLGSPREPEWALMSTRDEDRYKLKDQVIFLNPPGHIIVEEGDSLIFIAEDDDSYSPGELKLTNCDAPPEFAIPSKQQGLPPRPKTKNLLIGWRRDIQDMILELDKWVVPGSFLTLLSAGPDVPGGLSTEDRLAELEDNMCKPDEDLKNLELNILEENPIFRRELLKCEIETYDSILVLTESRPGAAGLSSDSRSMITMLLCRDIQRQKARDEGSVTFGYQKPSDEATVIAEILDPRTMELIKLAKTDDHVVSNALISMALGQMSEQADLGMLMKDLFSEEGNEIHIKDVRLFVNTEKPESLTFWEIMNRARQRCEVAIGYQRGADIIAGVEDKGIILNPANREEKITWMGPRVDPNTGQVIPGDKIVVIAEEVD